MRYRSLGACGSHGNWNVNLGSVHQLYETINLETMNRETMPAGLVAVEIPSHAVTDVDEQCEQLYVMRHRETKCNCEFGNCCTFGSITQWLEGQGTETSETHIERRADETTLTAANT